MNPSHPLRPPLSLRALARTRQLRAAALASPLLLAALAPAAHAADHFWTGGSFVDGVTAPNPMPLGDTLHLTDGGRKVLDGLSFENRGAIDWQGAGGIRLQGGATLINTGVIERIAFSSSRGMDTGTGGGSFINAGLFIGTGGSNSLALVGGTLINTGTIDNQSNSLFELPAGWVNTGTLTGRGSFHLGGTGLVNAGTIAPGSAGVGSLTLSQSNTFVQTAAGTLAIDITSASLFDFLDVAGSGFGDAALAGTLALHCADACSLAVGDEFAVLRAGRHLTGSFDQVTLNGFASGAFDVVYEINAGSDDDFVRLRVTQAVSAVPEPGAAALWLAGLVAVAGVAQRRRRRRWA